MKQMLKKLVKRFGLLAVACAMVIGVGVWSVNSMLQASVSKPGTAVVEAGKKNTKKKKNNQQAEAEQTPAIASESVTIEKEEAPAEKKAEKKSSDKRLKVKNLSLKASKRHPAQGESVTLTVELTPSNKNGVSIRDFILEITCDGEGGTLYRKTISGASVKKGKLMNGNRPLTVNVDFVPFNGGEDEVTVTVRLKDADESKKKIASSKLVLSAKGSKAVEENAEPVESEEADATVETVLTEEFPNAETAQDLEKVDVAETAPVEAVMGETAEDAEKFPAEEAVGETEISGEEPVESAQPAQDEQLVESEQPVEGEEPVESKQPVEGEEPVESEEPVEGEEPVESEEPVEGEEPVESEEPVEGEEPAESEESVEGEEPVDEEPVEGEEPVEDEELVEGEELPEEEEVAPEDVEISIKLLCSADPASLKDGEALTFTAVIEGIDPSLYVIRWQCDGGNGSWSDVEGASGHSYTITIGEDVRGCSWRFVVDPA